MVLAMPIAALASRADDVNAFMLTKGGWFAPENADAVKSQLMAAPDTNFKAAIAADYRDPQMMLIWALAGIDRFFLDDTLMGVLKVVTGGGFGIWWIIDLFSIKKRTFEYNFKLLSTFK
ncbi:MAG: TM2 domain-containing protein [Firmicutes bacterium]|nr:TM2 domain-containing protein [Bacillota bacterium]